MTSKTTSKTNEHTENFSSRLQDIPIAVIGVSALFPDAENKTQFWNNIMNEVDSITDVPPSRWNIDDYYDPDPSAPDKSYSKRGGFLPDIDFNPMEFGLPPNILEVTDVSQLLALVSARNVMDDAGYGDENHHDRKKVGITLGVGGGQKLMTPLTGRLQYPVWKKVLTNSGISDQDADVIINKIKKAYIPWEENSFPGFLGNVIAGRVANRLNLGGTNCVLDAACASSLTAVKMAISELLEYRSDMMISGGIDTDNSPFMYLSFSKTPAFTKDDHVKPFDAKSKGMLIGEGIGMVLLKRLEDAERDQDKIYAVIKGIGTSSDGKFKSIYAPRPEGQARALKQTYEKAGYNPDTIGLIEAHGTGTAAGDNAEFKALNSVFGEKGSQKQHIALGSVKSQIGHTKAAAGSAGLIKAVMALHHKVLPPTINVSDPHPDMNIEETPFYLNSETRPWFKKHADIPRRASVSSFGFGGTNFHITLEEYKSAHKDKFRIQLTHHMVVLAYETRDKLVTGLKSIKSKLDSPEKTFLFYDLVTDNCPRPVDQKLHRCGFVVKSPEEMTAHIEMLLEKLENNTELEKWSFSKGVSYRSQGINSSGKVVALFSGQGSQYLNMGRDLVYNFPPVMERFESINSLFQNNRSGLLTDIVYPIPSFTIQKTKEREARLQKTDYAQPAIGALSAGMYTLLTSAGFKADFAAGHSFGELTALWASGSLSDEDYHFLAYSRGKAMAPPDDDSFDAGTMMAVLGDYKTIQKAISHIPTVKIANHNSDRQSVIAGPSDDLKKAGRELKDSGYSVVPLPVSAAFHTELVEHAKKPFSEAIRSVTFKSPKIPVYSNSTSLKYPNDPEKVSAILENHILNPVYFKDEIENIHQDGGRIFVEFGPKNVLSKLTGTILKGKEHVTLSLNTNPRESSDFQLRKAAVELCVMGLPIHNPDPYGTDLLKPVPTKKNSMNIKINGASYVSEKTNASFREALTDGFQVAQAKPIIKKIEIPVEKIIEIPVKSDVSLQESEQDKMMNHLKNNNPPCHHTHPSGGKLNPNTDHEKTPSHLDYFFRHAHETLSVHSQYIANAGEYTRSFYQLMNQQIDYLNNNPGSGLPESIHKSMEMFHKYHGDTLKVHSEYLENNSFQSSAYLDSEDSPVSQKSFGYSDSINNQTKHIRPESSAMVIQQPEEKKHTGTKPSQPSNHYIPEHHKTRESGFKEQIKKQAAPAHYVPEHVMKNNMSVSVTPSHTKSGSSLSGKSPEQPVLTQSVEAHIPESSFQPDHIQSVMLNTVSEKTGYPTEMLELSMDMEADLGIDSIKRVEILASITEKCSEIPQVNPDELTEIKTLGGILDAFISAAEKIPEKTIQTEKINVAGLSDAGLESTVIKIVSEKTGYPEEMLDLDMDMEADLGIDSIKRVEILASVTETLPELSLINPDDLAEAKTLKHIIDTLKPFIQGTPKQYGTSQDAIPDSVIPDNDITDTMLSVVSDKTGYPVDMLDPDMDMEADLGIDSIKRVEILASVTEKKPELAQINPDDLSELKTLKEIIHTFSKSVFQENTIQPNGSNHHDPVKKDISESEITNIPSQNSIQLSMMSVVSDKTGYPVEMLDPDMDMEADLGIDSIKRVEILAAVTELNPNLRNVNPDELSVLKTLREIINTLNPEIPAQTNDKPVHSEPDTSHIPSEPKSIRQIASLIHLHRPDQIITDDYQDKYCILTDDGTELTQMVQSRFQKRGINTIVLRFPESCVSIQKSHRMADNTIEISQLDETTLIHTLTEIEKKFGPIHGFIHINPDFHEKTHHSLHYSQNEQELLQFIFLTAKHLKKPLNRNTHERPFFMTILRMDGHLGITGKGYSLLTGGYFGLTKSLNQEWEHVYCRACDISRSMNNDDASLCIEQELFDADNRITETSYLNNERFSLTAIPASPDFQEKNGGITGNSVFLVSGGAKGVTSDCVLQLAKDTSCKFILLGRSDYNEEPEPVWADGVTDESELKKSIMYHLKNQGETPTPIKINTLLKPLLSNRKIRSVLVNLKQAGSEAYYISADVTDTKSLQHKVRETEKQLGVVTGIIHGAGVLADHYIEDKTIEEYQAVYSTKVNGLFSLLKSVNQESLSHVALFSSAAGFYGNEGQSDYAVANEILNKTTYKLKASIPGCHINSFNWGPWDGGMVTPELKRLFEDRGTYVIPVHKGSLLFSEELRMKECFPQIIIGNSMKKKTALNHTREQQHLVSSTLRLEENRFLYDHSIAGSPVLPTVCATTWMAETCEKYYPGFTFFKCLNYKLFKGIVFDGKQPEIYTIKVKEIENPSHDSIVCSVLILSTDSYGKDVYHYSSDINLVSEIPQSTSIYTPDLNETDIRQGSEFYQNGTLFHGSYFQSIERIINMNKNGLTMECRSPDVPSKDQGMFRAGTFNPFAADVQFQSMLIWVREYLKAGSLPSMTEEGIHYSNVPADIKFYVTLRIKKQTESTVTADIITHDRDGKVYTRVNGASVTVSKQLNNLFTKAV